MDPYTNTFEVARKINFFWLSLSLKKSQDVAKVLFCAAGQMFLLENFARHYFPIYCELMKDSTYVMDRRQEKLGHLIEKLLIEEFAVST